MQTRAQRASSISSTSIVKATKCPGAGYLVVLSIVKATKCPGAGFPGYGPVLGSRSRITRTCAFPMVDDTDASGAAPAPKIVEYDPITGVPPEFNEFLPPDLPEYKKWKAAQEGPEALEKLTLKDKEGNEIEKKLPGGKVKTKQKAVILLETKERQKNKKMTMVSGLELFGIKLSEASKLFGKKFACGASVTKTATQTEQIEMQGDFMNQLAELIFKTYSKTNSVTKDDIFFIGEDKKKRNYFAGGDDSDEQ